MANDLNQTLELPFTEENYNTFKFFIELMTRHDRMHGPDTVVYCQPIAEVSKSLPTANHFPFNLQNLDTAYDILEQFNYDGYSCHWGINEIGYMGTLPLRRTADEVTRIRAFAVDIDQPITLPLLNVLIDIYKPTCVVLSSRKTNYLEEEPLIDPLILRHYADPLKGKDEQGEFNYCFGYKVHFYWQIHNFFGPPDYTEKIPRSHSELALLDNWPKFQNALAWDFDDCINELLGYPIVCEKHWTDKNILKLNNTLRLPGFWHCKDPNELFISQIYYANSDSVLGIDNFKTFFTDLEITQKSVTDSYQRLHDYKESLKKTKITNPETGETKEVLNYTEGYPGANAANHNRNESLHAYVCHLVFARNLKFDEVNTIALAANSERNVPPLERTEVHGICQSVWSEKQRREKKLTEDRLKSGDSSALLSKFQDVLKDFKTRNANPVSATLGLTPDQDEEPPKHAMDASWEERINPKLRFVYDYSSSSAFDSLDSDSAVAERLKQRFKSGIVLHSDGELWVYDGKKGTWNGDKQRPFDLCEMVCTDTLSDPTLQNTYRNKNGSTDEKGWKATQKTLRSEKKISSVIKLVKHDSKLKIDAQSFDANPTLLNCANGVVNISSGDVRPHEKNQLHTFSTNVRLLPSFPLDVQNFKDITNNKTWWNASPWTRFIYEIMGKDIEMAQYLQKIFGYCLSGTNPNELIFFMHGVGSNGKSVFIETLMSVMGEYSNAVPSSIFLKSGKDQSSILSQVVGKRILGTSEVGYGRQWDEEIIKNITGNDTICVRGLYKASFQYKPGYKVIVRGNYRPKIEGADYGIWRRIRPVPFDILFSKRRADTGLINKFQGMTHEILSWGVAGYQMFLEQGLEAPKRAQLDIEDYRDDTMPLTAFLREVFDLDALGINIIQDPEKPIGTYSKEANVLSTTANGHDHSYIEPEFEEPDNISYGVYTSENKPPEYRDEVTTHMLYRLYLDWYSSGSGRKLEARQVSDGLVSMGVKKARIILKDNQGNLKPLWCLGLLVKAGWLIRIKTGHGKRAVSKDTARNVNDISELDDRTFEKQ